MKKLIILGLLCFCFNGAVFGYTDGPAQVQRHVQFVEQMKRWAKQMKQYEEQIKIAKQELKSLTGVKNIESVLSEMQNLKSSFKSLTEQFSDINGLLDKGFDGLDPKTRNIFEKNGIGKTCQNQDEQLKKLCEAQIAFQIGNTTAQEQMIKDVSRSVDKLGQLAEGAKNAKDSKEALDYSNQINATLAMLQAQEMQNNLRRQNEEKMEKLAREKEKYLTFKKIEENSDKFREWLKNETK